MEELFRWLEIDMATRKQLQLLIGKLNFIANCIRAGRVFLTRLINAINSLLEKGKAHITEEICKDV